MYVALVKIIKPCLQMFYGSKLQTYTENRKILFMSVYLCDGGCVIFLLLDPPRTLIIVWKCSSMTRTNSKSHSFVLLQGSQDHKIKSNMKSNTWEHNSCFIHFLSRHLVHIRIEYVQIQTHVSRFSSHSPSTRVFS